MVLAILQARMSSTRLPGKVLRPIVGRPMLSLQLERLRRAQALEDIVVATSSEPSDDVLERFCREEGVRCHRGPLQDVLGRFIQTLDACSPVETFVRLTADCPLADAALLDQAVAAHQAAGADYTNVQQTWSYPKGLDVEVCQSEVLRQVHREAVGADREHVTSFIYARPERFRLCFLNRDPPLRYRWTVDTPEDFAFVQAVYEDLYAADPGFDTEAVLEWQHRHPDQVRIAAEGEWTA